MIIFFVFTYNENFLKKKHFVNIFLIFKIGIDKFKLNLH